MAIDQQDESRVYLEFLEAVRGFNQANAIHVEEMHRLEQESQAALAQAAKTHLTPVLGKLQTVQLVGGAIAVISLMLMLCTCGIWGSGTNTSSRGNEADAMCMFVLPLVFFLPLMAVGVAVFAWALHRASMLRAKIKQIQRGTWIGDRGGHS
jgi:hypothetical protein